MSNLSASLEDYLETIYEIAERKGAARPKDIADKHRVKPASVTGALKHLAEKKLVNYAPYDVVTLTGTGKKIAREILRKHNALLGFFTNVLDIPREDVEEFACEMEHTIPDRVLERFVEFAEFVDKCPHRGAIWREGAHGYFCKPAGSEQTLCKDCQLEKQ